MQRDKKVLPAVTALFTILLSFPLFAGTVSLTKAPLFVIERSKNANEVHYVAQLTEEGVLYMKKPVHAFWINWEKDSTGKDQEELNLVEKRMAFGFSICKSRSPQSCTMKLVCCPDRPIRVFICEGTVRAETTINGQSAHLQKISVITSEKRKILPQVLSVTVSGTIAATGEAVEEIIKPR
jgi:hypothetical protein